MHFKVSDLQQLDDERVRRLAQAQKDVLLSKLLADLKEAHDRLQANSRTSSRPPSSDPPWSKAAAGADSEAAPERNPDDSPDNESATEADATTPTESAVGQEPTPKRPGRQPGMKGHSRTVSLAISAIIRHEPEQCVVCNQELDRTLFVARTGLYVLDIETETAGLCGLRVRHDKHLYGEVPCSCGHLNRTEPGRCPDEPLWTIPLSEWHLVGPTLASLIVCLSHRLHLSRCKSQEFLRDWLGLELSTATISRCLHEVGRAVEPLEEQLVEELRQASLVHADETRWKEWGKPLWLWVITSATLCLYFIGHRSKEIMDNVFEDGFAGWLMSDGYVVYRHFQHRLRCWAHLKRKTQGLRESLSDEARAFGETSHDLLTRLIAAVNQARAGPGGDLSVTYQAELDDFRALCERHHDCGHEKTRALAREFLNDWEAIWIVLAHPHLPLTNNEAEQALRHWVINRRISHGTRTEQGSRSLALLASVIETCRKRGILPWPYLAQVIAERRKGNPVPPLPTAAA